MRLIVLANPGAGRGRGKRYLDAALPVLRAGADVTLVQGNGAQDARDRLAQALGPPIAGPAGDPPPIVVAVGGDGTVHLALQEALRASSPLAIIPAGSGNDGARTLGIPLGDPVLAAQVVVRGRTVPVDVGHARTADGADCHFLCVLSTGFDSAVNERANMMRWPNGRARYVRATLAELRTFQAAEYEVRVDDRPRRDAAMLVSIGNGPSYGGGMLVCPAADIHDGLLSLLWLRRIGKLEFLRTFPKVFTGRHVGHPAVSQDAGSKVWISAAGQVAYADGERLGALPVEVTSRPGALTVVVPALPGPDHRGRPQH